MKKSTINIIFNTLLIFSLLLPNLGMNLKANLKESVNTEVSSQSNAILTAVQNFQPYVYTHSSEAHFPVTLETLNIQWVSDLTDTNSNVTYNYAAGATLDNSARVYAKVNKKSAGGYLFTYAYVFAYNACGPKFYVQAGAVGIDIDKSVSVCPAGVHNGDIEHAVVTVDSNLNFVSITLAYHAWDKTYTSSEITWSGTHPIAYMANGSHALYPTAGSQYYKEVWNVKEKGSYPCGIKWCKKLGVKYPCGTNSCSYTQYSTYGSLMDSTEKSNLFTGVVKVVASDAWTFDSSALTSDEVKFLAFQGRFGAQISSTGWSTAVTTIKTLLSPITLVCSSCKTAIYSGISSAESELQSEAPKSLATKGWWINSGV